MKKSNLFRNGAIDLWLLSVIPLQVASFLAFAYWYHAMTLPWLILTAVLLFLFSVQNAGANHNHYHTPIFNIEWLNTLARLGFTLTGSPKTPFNIRHGLHHSTHRSYNETSFRAMIGIKPNPVVQIADFLLFVTEAVGLKYIVLLTLLKIWPVERVARIAAPTELETATKLFERLKSPRLLKKTYLDLTVWLVFRALLIAIDWKFFFLFFIPVSYVVTKIRDADNYFQHWGATDPFDDLRDSVSAYGRIWNLLTFNLGYHQEHHLEPATHWTKLPEVTKKLPTDRRFVKGSQYSNCPLWSLETWRWKRSA